MNRTPFWFRIRFKLLLVALTLLGIPWAGYRFIQETEHFLRDAQNQALISTARSVANLVHSQDQVFHGVARPDAVVTFRNLFLHELDRPPQIDGYRDEWVRFDNNFTLLQSSDGQLEARVFVGRHERYLYLLIAVSDATSNYGEYGDAVDLALVSATGALQRLRIQPHAPGWITAKAIPPDPRSGNAAPNGLPVRGEWQKATDGYTVELRLPRDAIADRLSIRLFDAGSRQALASGRVFPADRIGRLVERSPSLDRLLSTITPPSTRVWVTDHQGLVLAQAGVLDIDAPPSPDEARLPWFVGSLIRALLPRQADLVAELPDNQSQLFVAPVIEALSGRPASQRRERPWGDAIVVSAAVPIRGSNGIQGAVMVEQTTRAVLSIQNLALQRLFVVTLVLFAVTSLGLLAFASLLASRITYLRDQVEAAVDSEGRIVGCLDAVAAKDEIGDLGRSFVGVMGRLQERNRQLEDMLPRIPTRSPTIAPFDLATVVHAQVDAARVRCPAPDITLEASGPLRIEGLAGVVGLATRNLLLDMCTAPNPARSISISCARQGDDSCLSVFGAGLDPSHWEMPDMHGAPSSTDLSTDLSTDRAPAACPRLGLTWLRLTGDLHHGWVSVTRCADPPGVRVTLCLPSRQPGPART